MGLIALVEERLPERFYVRGEPLWRMGATALAARMAGIVESILRLADAHRPSDTSILVRALYEYAVSTCWLLIDPTRCAGGGRKPRELPPSTAVVVSVAEKSR